MQPSWALSLFIVIAVLMTLWTVQQTKESAFDRSILRRSRKRYRRITVPGVLLFICLLLIVFYDQNNLTATGFGLVSTGIGILITMFLDRKLDAEHQIVRMAIPIVVLVVGALLRLIGTFWELPGEYGMIGCMTGFVFYFIYSRPQYVTWRGR